MVGLATAAGEVITYCFDHTHGNCPDNRACNHFCIDFLSLAVVRVEETYVAVKIKNLLFLFFFNKPNIIKLF